MPKWEEQHIKPGRMLLENLRSVTKTQMDRSYCSSVKLTISLWLTLYTNTRKADLLPGYHQMVEQRTKLITL